MIKTLATIVIIITGYYAITKRHDEATQNRLDQVCFERWGESTIGSSAYTDTCLFTFGQVLNYHSE
jgi:hypothetical protein